MIVVCKFGIIVSSQDLFSLSYFHKLEMNKLSADSYDHIRYVHA